tara:strand:+ start:827 stop:958 length:132 start_codon:yes stop_codon:yes gene_type:complete
MNAFLQNLIIAVVVLIAVLYLFRKQIWSSGKNKKDCGNDGCGC